MDCVLMAGGIPGPQDPLYPYAQGQPKSLIELAGKPMVQWVVDALNATPSVDRIIVVGLDASAGIASPKITVYLPDQGGLLSNALAGIEQLLALAPDTRQTLACCGDIPLVTAEMLEWLIAASTDTAMDIHYCNVPRELMETRFPSSARSYIHFKDGDVAGGDVHVAAPRLLTHHKHLWAQVISQRKSQYQLALRLGPGFFIKLLLRQLTQQAARDIVAARFGLQIQPLRARYAELGMDIDKPHQLELCRRELATRQP